MNTNKLDFIFAPRFIAMVLGSASAILVDPMFSTQPWYISLGKFLALVSAGFVTVGTIDRWSDKKVEAATKSGQVTTVSMPATGSTVTATTAPIEG